MTVTKATAVTAALVVTAAVAMAAAAAAMEGLGVAAQPTCRCRRVYSASRQHRFSHRGRSVPFLTVEAAAAAAAAVAMAAAAAAVAAATAAAAAMEGLGVASQPT